MMKIPHLATLFALPLLTCHASFEQHYRKITERTGSSQFRNVDFIYLINLDQRSEKLDISLKQLARYNLYPQRFPAVYGWKLSEAVLNDVGLKYLPGMWAGKDKVLYFLPNRNGDCIMDYLNDSYYGKTVFNSWTTSGAIGCTLSHLSVLQDAYDAGYKTIWVLEDDFFIEDSPYKLSDCIDQLDALVGEDGWDILYTDNDYLKGIDEDKDLLTQMPYKWRPDMPLYDLSPMLEHTDVGDNFIKIGCRTRTHSMLIRRSGIKKILDFYRTHHIFMPYDHENAFVPDIQLYVMKHTIVTTREAASDTKEIHFR